MKARRLDRLGGELHLEDVPTPVVRPGSVLARIEASALPAAMEAAAAAGSFECVVVTSPSGVVVDPN